MNPEFFQTPTALLVLLIVRTILGFITLVRAFIVLMPLENQ